METRKIILSKTFIFLFSLMGNIPNPQERISRFDYEIPNTILIPKFIVDVQANDRHYKADNISTSVLGFHPTKSSEFKNLSNSQFSNIFQFYDNAHQSNISGEDDMHITDEDDDSRTRMNELGAMPSVDADDILVDYLPARNVKLALIEEISSGIRLEGSFIMLETIQDNTRDFGHRLNSHLSSPDSGEETPGLRATSVMCLVKHSGSFRNSEHFVSSDSERITVSELPVSSCLRSTIRASISVCGAEYSCSSEEVTDEDDSDSEDEPSVNSFSEVPSSCLRSGIRASPCMCGDEYSLSSSEVTDEDDSDSDDEISVSSFSEARTSSCLHSSIRASPSVCGAEYSCSSTCVNSEDANNESDSESEGESSVSSDNESEGASNANSDNELTSSSCMHSYSENQVSFGTVGFSSSLYSSSSVIEPTQSGSDVFTMYSFSYE